MSSETETAIVAHSFSFSVYHSDHGIVPEAMGWIKQKLPDVVPAGTPFFIRELTLPDNLPPARNALYGPASGDAPVPEEAVTLRPRGDRPWSDRTVPWPTRLTRRVQVIGARKEDGNFVLYTVYGGPLAPQNPDDPGCADKASAQAFWAEHALSIEQWGA
jgi:hypothetical protein